MNDPVAGQKTDEMTMMVEHGKFALIGMDQRACRCGDGIACLQPHEVVDHRFPCGLACRDIAQRHNAGFRTRSEIDEDRDQDEDDVA